MFHLKETHSVKNDDALKILVSSAQTLKMAAAGTGGSGGEPADNMSMCDDKSKQLNGKSNSYSSPWTGPERIC